MFKAVPAEAARALVQAVYPRYYVGAAITGAVALSAFVAGPLVYHEYRGLMVGVQALAIIFAIVLMFYGGNTLTPAICAAGREPVSNPKRLEQLQRREALLNLVVLVIGLSLLVAHAARPAPRTSGIIELMPQERAALRRGAQPGHRGC